MIAVMIVIASLVFCSGGAYYHTCYQNDGHKQPTCARIENVVLEQWHRFNDVFLDHNQNVDVPDIPSEPEQCMLRLTDEIDILVRRQHMMMPNCDPEKEIIRRPWGCNIPFAYIFHSKCRRMATLEPIFDLQALINSMIQ